MPLSSNIGSSSGAGTSIDVTYSAPGAAGCLQAVFCVAATATDPNDAAFPGAATDDGDSGQGWTTSTSSLPIIGLAASDDTEGPGGANIGYMYPDPFTRIMIGSIGRSCSAGESGGTLTLPFGGTVTDFSSIDVIIVYCQAAFLTDEWGGEVVYGYSDAYPQLSFTPELDWPTDYSGDLYVPDFDGVAIKALAGTGSGDGTYTQGFLGVTVESVSGGADYDPSGAPGGSITVGNFQVMKPVMGGGGGVGTEGNGNINLSQMRYRVFQSA